MKSIPRNLRLLVIVMALPSLLPLLPASGAAVRKGKAPAIASRRIDASNTVIALPLTPIVPAAQRLCASRAPSGLGYTMLRAAWGPSPAGEDTVLVNYIGYLAATGAVFDQGMQTPLAVDGVIPGFSQGLRMTARTGITRLCIPAAMGYGARASGPIPANSDLVFQIELLDFRTASKIEEMREARAPGSEMQRDAEPQP